MIDSLLHLLATQTIALSLAVLAARGLQALVARRFGASAAYVCWLLVPVALVAVALPHAASDALTLRVDVTAVAPGWITAPSTTRPGTQRLAGTVGVAAWAVGVLLLATVFARRQWRFEALASPRLPAGSGPAVLGVLRRRIVLPQDFDSAFDGEERRLMLLHEGVHLRRGDNAWNLLATALFVLHWFNPLAWWAWRCMRGDQETSCDAEVLRHESPAALATYAGALLKVQGVALTPPLATSWQSTHPLVERVRMLQLHRITSARHRTGLRIAALSILVAGCGGYALQAGASAPAERPVSVMTAIEIQVDGGAAIKARLLTQAGQTATVRLEPDAKNALPAPLEIAYAVTRLDGDRLRLDTTLREGSPLSAIGSPRVITLDGEVARIGVRTSDGAHGVALSLLPHVLGAALPALPPLPAAPAMSPLPSLPQVPATSALPALPSAPALPALPASPPQRAL